MVDLHCNTKTELIFNFDTRINHISPLFFTLERRHGMYLLTFRLMINITLRASFETTNTLLNRIHKART